MKRIWLVFALVTALSLASCGNVNDTDGRIGNEAAEKNEDSLMDRAEDIKEDVKDKAEDIKEDVKEGAEDLGEGMKDAAEGVMASSDGVRLNTEQAKLAAVSDVGYTVKEVTFYRAYLTKDSEKEYYDVEFSFRDTVYDYEIDPYSGAVLSKGTEANR